MTSREQELEQVLDACEAANMKHLQRIEELEQLCRDLYCFVDIRMWRFWQGDNLDERMDELGLLEVSRG